MSYYNTTHLLGKELKDSIDKASNQEAKILIYFEHKKEPLTPSDVWKVLFNTDQTPLTSVRRAITDLTKEDKLIKTEEFKEGMFGKPEYYWKLKN